MGQSALASGSCSSVPRAIRHRRTAENSERHWVTPDWIALRPFGRGRARSQQLGPPAPPPPLGACHNANPAGSPAHRGRARPCMQHAPQGWDARARIAPCRMQQAGRSTAMHANVTRRRHSPPLPASLAVVARLKVLVGFVTRALLRRGRFLVCRGGWGFGVGVGGGRVGTRDPGPQR